MGKRILVFLMQRWWLFLVVVLIAVGVGIYLMNRPEVLEVLKYELVEKTPDGWFVAGRDPQDYNMGFDHVVTHSGEASAYLKSKVSKPRSFGTLMQMFKAEDYRGKRVRISGYVKAEKIENWAGLWMRVDGPENMSLSFDNMQNRPIKGTIDWTKHEIVLDVPENSINIALGILLSGKGQVWIDDLQFEVVGKDVPTTDLLKDVPTTDLLVERAKEFPKQPLNLDFEG